MRAVVQRVEEAKVKVNEEVTGKIKQGLLLLLGISNDDDIKDIKWLADKIMNLRIFEDKDGKMNLSLLETGGELLIVSQFTLYGDCRKGRRPSFTESAPPEKANEIYLQFLDYVKSNYNINLQTGKFQTEMKVHLINDGPVTFILESKKTF
ncbi:D-aminoacyl-tRNA deacylase [Oceanotoga sp. DSM 15011]|uniref:D-aminoacyl-tRNA deacylase n=1 Tax=Oceanotoga teriensis TaxID=515440 RepID=A0AA45C5Z6_9BACT|nr:MULTISPECIES: D-aminoacyl-tRNA deacylase [Oceanotoga]MDN5341463.1 D-aminoacyl-tRNA deacylase [Oceanotoga sp.]MDO7977631.1 D-aminoacyl-tRNA deacylase [Oceanotoga teriensis]PWJ90080.1 D-tyrosyl-tRNA(Tyr) deacylase [Oceanotoga teriensis]UYP00494.1 D-aminoacyl-tRNA deacylase [Oceanotoga sp. DSM 15011]